MKAVPSLPQDIEDPARKEFLTKAPLRFPYTTPEENMRPPVPMLRGFPLSPDRLEIELKTGWTLKLADDIFDLLEAFTDTETPGGALRKLVVLVVDAVPDWVLGLLIGAINVFRRVAGIFFDGDKADVKKPSEKGQFSVFELLSVFSWRSSLNEIKNFTDDVGNAIIANATATADNRLGPKKSVMDTPDSIDDFEELFADMPASKRPTSIKEYGLPDTFARYRLAGPNPNILKRCPPEVRDIWFRALDDGTDGRYATVKQTVDAATAAGELYLADFTDFYGLTGPAVDGATFKVQKYVAPCAALFVVNPDAAAREREPLKAVAIQLETAPRLDPKKPFSSLTTPVIFCPPDAAAVAAAADGGAKDWSWECAMACYTSSDGAYHEAISHLGMTHLVVGAFIPATLQRLHPDHPLHRLLLPHFYGTSLINFGAHSALLSDTGAVAQLVSLKIQDVLTYTAAKVIDALSQDLTFPADLKRRGMTKEEFPYLYPYRDDAQLHWDAIRTWVEEYLAVYYGSDAATRVQRMANDPELNAWMKDLTSPIGGNIKWLASEWSTSAGADNFPLLCDAVAAVMWRASVLHAAVNFPQAPIMAFLPAYPLAIYAQPPTDARARTFAEYLAYLGPLEMAQTQATTANLLGTLFYSEIGRYGYKQFGGHAQVDSAMGKFRSALDGITAAINARNEALVANWTAHYGDADKGKLHAYTTLLPKNVPQSINI